MLLYDNTTSGGRARTDLQCARRQARRLAIHAVADRDLPIPQPGSRLAPEAPGDVDLHLQRGPGAESHPKLS